MEQIKWFERKFAHDLPLSVMPLIIDRLRGAPIRLEYYVANLPKEILVKKDGNTWSIQEHVGHLADLEELHEGRIDDFLAGKATLRAADVTNRKTHEANHNKANIKDLLDNFRKVRTHYISRLEALDDKVLNHVAIHPRLNAPWRPVDMAHFVAEHDDQHLATIHALISKWS